MRLIVSPLQDGIVNMATDHAIMEAVGENRVAPTLRFYGWQPPCLSLGYAQSVRDLDLDRINSRGWMVVRRPTGGRAILHTDELTYSLSMPQDHRLVEGDISTSYRRISAALRRGLEILGVDAQAQQHAKPSDINAICFETPSDYEITIDGKKIIGSAQVRKHKAVLQHGTIPLTGDLARICDALAYPNMEAREAAGLAVKQRATTVEDGLGTPVSFDEAVAAFKRAFEETFDLYFDDGELTPDESLRLEHLRVETYGNDLWTYRR